MIMLFIVPPQIAYFWPILLLAYKYAATIGMLPSQHYHQGTIVCSYQPDTSVPMLPSQCHIAKSKEMAHKIILYVLTFFSKSGKKK